MLCGGNIVISELMSLPRLISKGQLHHMCPSYIKYQVPGIWETQFTSDSSSVHCPFSKGFFFFSYGSQARQVDQGLFPTYHNFWFWSSSPSCYSLDISTTQSIQLWVFLFLLQMYCGFSANNLTFNLIWVLNFHLPQDQWNG